MIIPPDIHQAHVKFTREQLREIYDRIELIDQHFSRCCAFHQDSCHYGEEHSERYGRLILAGVPDHKAPFDQSAFEAWLETYGVES